MITISGELYIGLPLDFLYEAEAQDNINKATIKSQLYYSKLDHKNNKKFKKPNVLKLYEKPLAQIAKEKDGDEFAKYVVSVLNKLFPHPELDEQVGYNNNKYNLDDIFDFGGRAISPYEYAKDYRPSNYWDDLLPEKDRENTLTFNVTPYATTNEYLIAKITFDFTTPRDIYVGQIMRPIVFVKEILFALDESPFFENLQFFNDDSFTTYYEENTYDGKTITNDYDNGTYKLIGFHLVDKNNRIDKEIKDLVPFNPNDELDGTLITINEAETNGFMNYDGYGYLCKEINGQMYKSFISPDMDYALPKIYRDNFTHMLWFNR